MQCSYLAAAPPPLFICSRVFCRKVLRWLEGHLRNVVCKLYCSGIVEKMGHIKGSWGRGQINSRNIDVLHGPAPFVELAAL